MGTDIHMVLEQKDEISGEWVGVNDLPYIEGHAWAIRDRNYEFFAALASVRGAGPDPLGAPPDPSSLTLLRLRGWGADAHSMSYLSAKEFLKLFCDSILHHEEQAVAAQEVKRMLEGTWYADAMNKYFSTHMPGEEVPMRVVFWFDN